MEDAREMSVVDSKNQVLVFGSDTPEGVIERATQIANILAPLVKDRKLFVTMRGRDHVYAEGWTTMIAMLGIFPHTEWCKRLEREGEIAYEARVVLRHVSGNQVGAGEALCSSQERNWSTRDEYAIKSMAQTRAVGKACRLSFSWIMALSGYDPTPAEEMGEGEPPRNKAVVDAPVVSQVTQTQEALSDKQRAFFWAEMKRLNLGEDVSRAIVRHVRGQESTAGMTKEQMDLILVKGREFAAESRPS